MIPLARELSCFANRRLWPAGYNEFVGWIEVPHTPCTLVPGLVTWNWFDNHTGGAVVDTSRSRIILPTHTDSAASLLAVIAAQIRCKLQRGLAMRVKQICTMLAFIVLGGCATGGLKYAEVRSSTPKLQGGYARIYFYRSGTPIGVAVQPDLKINGEKVGSATPNGFFFVDRRAGKYDISATTEVEEKISVTLLPGETKYVQFYITPGIFVGHANLNVVSREKAEQDMADLSQTGAQ
jgi:hypothetical protein